MPAVLSANLHSGFLNEEYGLFLLRQIAAVAPIGRAEDFGVDAVATLLPSANGFLHASDTFQIQLKSASVKVVEYGAPDTKGEDQQHIKGELHWLRSLQIPLFFGSVSQMAGDTPGKLRIYSSQHLMGPLLLYPEFTRIQVCFDAADANPSNEQEGAEMDRLGAESQGISTDVQRQKTWVEQQYRTFLTKMNLTSWWLDLPIVEFDLQDVSGETTREHLIAVLQRWVRVGYENIERAPLGMFTFLKWKTNQLPEIERKQMSPREPSREQVAQIMRAVAHPAFTYLLERLYHGTRTDLDAIIAVLEGMARDGADISLQKEFIEQNWEHLKTQREKYRRDRNLP